MPQSEVVSDLVRHRSAVHNRRNVVAGRKKLESAQGFCEAPDAVRGVGRRVGYARQAAQRGNRRHAGVGEGGAFVGNPDIQVPRDVPDRLRLDDIVQVGLHGCLRAELRWVRPALAQVIDSVNSGFGHRIALRIRSGEAKLNLEIRNFYSAVFVQVGGRNLLIGSPLHKCVRRVVGFVVCVRAQILVEHGHLRLDLSLLQVGEGSDRLPAVDYMKNDRNRVGGRGKIGFLDPGFGLRDQLLKCVFPFQVRVFRTAVEGRLLGAPGGDGIGKQQQ